MQSELHKDLIGLLESHGVNPDDEVIREAIGMITDRVVAVGDDDDDDQMVGCIPCYGTGSFKGDHNSKCNTCGGTGQITQAEYDTIADNYPEGWDDDDDECPDCGGLGYLPEFGDPPVECMTCQ